MNYNVVKEVLNYQEIENKRMFVPNEIFEDFSIIKAGSSAKSFCFSFYYLIMYLYRFTKYKDRYYSVQDLKEILGYSRVNKTMDKFISRNGILEGIGYLSHTTDEPNYWLFDYDKKTPIFLYDSDFVNDHTEEEMKDYRKDGAYVSKKNKSIKVPTRGIYRTKESLNNNIQDGVFFNIRNTTKITVEAFMFCVSHEDLGVEGFWIYSYIKRMNDLYNDTWNRSRDDISNDTGVKLGTLNKILISLESHDMITNDHKPFVIGAPLDAKFKACSYRALDSSIFNPTRRTIPKQEIISFQTWTERNESAPVWEEDPFSDDTEFEW